MHQKLKWRYLFQISFERRIIFILIFTAIIPIHSFAITPITIDALEAKPDGSPQDLVVELDKDHLTVVAYKARLDMILSKISAATGIAFHLNGPLELSISDNFSNLPVEMAIRRLTRGYNCAFIYARKNPNMKLPVLASVFIYLGPSGSFSTLGEPIISDSEPASDPLISDLPEIEPPISEFERLKEAAFEGKEEALSHLIDISLNEQNEVVREASIEALGSIGQERVMDALIEGLHDDEAWIRAASVRAIAEHGGERARNALMVALEDPVAEVREVARLIMNELDEGDAENDNSES